MSFYDSKAFKTPNRFMNWLYLVRAWIILLGFISILAGIIYLKITHHDFKDVLSFVIGGVGFITLFLTILNVHQSTEANHTKILFDKQKFENDTASNKLNIAYSMASDWFKSMTIYARTGFRFIEDNRKFIMNGDLKTFNKRLTESEDARLAVNATLNYFEAISNAIRREMVDEKFLQDFFKSIFLTYHENLASYIHFKRKKMNNDRLFECFTHVCDRWKTLNNN
jgi:hypothetical protein